MDYGDKILRSCFPIGVEGGGKKGGAPVLCRDPHGRVWGRAGRADRGKFVEIVLRSWARWQLEKKVLTGGVHLSVRERERGHGWLELALLQNSL